MSNDSNPRRQPATDPNATAALPFLASGLADGEAEISLKVPVAVSMNFGPREVRPAASGTSAPPGLWPELAGVEVIGGVDADAPWNCLAGDAGGEEAPLRKVDDPWSSAAVRTVLRVLLLRRMGAGSKGAARARAMGEALPLLPVPGTTLPSLLWATSAPQEEFDEWRAATPDAEASLRAAGNWVLGRTPSLAAAYAAEFTGPCLLGRFLDRLDARDRDVLLRRARGETLADIAEHLDVSRERVRQIAVKGHADVAAALAAAHGVGNPAVDALAHHVRRLSGAVLASASERDGLLRDDERSEWIARALPPKDAIVLLVTEDLLEALTEEVREEFDNFPNLGIPLAGGRTSLGRGDADLDRLRAACIGLMDAKPFAPVAKVAAEAGLPADVVRRLASLASVELFGSFVVREKWRADELRAGFAEGVLAAADRPLHMAEIFLAGLGPPDFPEWTFRTLRQSLLNSPDIFATDGFGLWALVGATGGGEPRDLRPPPPASVRRADARLPRQVPHEPLLEGMDPTVPTFAEEAGLLLGLRVEEVGHRGRLSLAQAVGHPDDLAALLRWLAEGVRPRDEAPEADVGMTLLAATVAAARTAKAGGRDAWEALRDACGPEMRRLVFNSQDAATGWTQSAILRAVHVHRLRHALDHHDDAWVTLLRLQWGFMRGDLELLPDWVRGDDPPPPAVRHLAADPSTGMAELWAVLEAAEAGAPDAAALLEEAASSPWWPGWRPDEILGRLGRPKPERTRAEARQPSRPGNEAQADPAEELHPPQPPEPVPPTANVPPFTPRVRLGVGAERFEMELPARLDVPEGPLVAVGDGFRVAGIASASGGIDWQDGGWASVPVRGPSRRRVTIRFAGGEREIAPDVALWEPDSFLAVYDLGSSCREALDPYSDDLSAAGPHAVLLHQSLAPSDEPDEGRTLDGDYRLLVFWRGLPNGFSVSLGGRVVWQLLREERSHLVEGVEARLTGDAGDLHWGEVCALAASELPDGFVPTRARIGGQTLRCASVRPPWTLEGYVLLPGMNPLFKKGRIEGRLNGQRASVRATLSLRRAARGALLRRGDAIRLLLHSSTLDRSSAAGWRLWVLCPADEASGDHVLLEGAREAARFSQDSVRLDGTLLGFGEPLFMAPSLFNRQGRTTPVAEAVLDRGDVSSHSVRGSKLHVEFSRTIAWTGEHRIRGWGQRGITDLPVVETIGMGIEAELPGWLLSGVAISYGNAWLGSAHLGGDARIDVARWLAEGDPGERVAFALAARLPVLAPAAAKAAARRLRLAGHGGLAAVLPAAADAERDYVLGRLLEMWLPQDGLADELARDFLAAVEQTRPRVAVLERLLRVAPCAAVRAIREGMRGLATAERKRVLVALAVRSLPVEIQGEARARLSPVNPEACVAEVDRVLLDAACAATRLDRQFLEARAEGSILSMAWAAATTPVPSEPPRNLVTALALPPVRRWLAARLLARLILSGP